MGRTRAFLLCIALIATIAVNALAGQWRQVAFQAADGFRLHGELHLPDGVPMAPPSGSSAEDEPAREPVPDKKDVKGNRDGEPARKKPAPKEKKVAKKSKGNGERGSVPFVVFVHDFGQDRKTCEALIKPLTDAGFAVFLFDQRGHGESSTSDTQERVEDRDPKLARDVYDDLRGAYDWLAEQPGLDRARFALVGAQAGASIALDYAARDKSVDAIVCLSPSLRPLGMDTRGDLRQLTGRKILLVGGAEDEEACDKMEGLCDGLRRKQYEEDGRGAELVSSAEAKDYLVDFLKTSLGDPGKDVVFASIASHIYHPGDSEWVQRIKPTNLRYFSSAEEAESRGLRLTRSKQASDDEDEDMGGGKKRPPKGNAGKKP